MAWYFNFCAPHIPNDPTINLHRLVQTICLLVFLVLCCAIYVYFKIWANGTSEKDETASSNSSTHTLIQVDPMKLSPRANLATRTQTVSVTMRNRFLSVVLILLEVRKIPRM